MYAKSRMSEHRVRLHVSQSSQDSENVRSMMGIGYTSSLSISLYTMNSLKFHTLVRCGTDFHIYRCAHQPADHSRKNTSQRMWRKDEQTKNITNAQNELEYAQN